MNFIENTPDDPCATRCGHNFSPSKCPYRHCAMRDMYDSLEWLTCYLEEGATPRPEHVTQAREALTKARGEAVPDAR